jgi:hypothetical protein
MKLYFKIRWFKLSLQQAVRPIALSDIEAPTFSLDSRLTDGGKVVSLKRRQPFTLEEDSWCSFLLDAESTPGP